jgi:hypothetical protein
MERPALLNVPDFFIIGLMSIMFLLMIGVLAEAYMSYKHGKSSSTGASA